MSPFFNGQRDTIITVLLARNYFRNVFFKACSCSNYERPTFQTPDPALTSEGTCGEVETIEDRIVRQFDMQHGINDDQQAHRQPVCRARRHRG